MFVTHDSSDLNLNKFHIIGLCVFFFFPNVHDFIINFFVNLLLTLVNETAGNCSTCHGRAQYLLSVDMTAFRLVIHDCNVQ